MSGSGHARASRETVSLRYTDRHGTPWPVRRPPGGSWSPPAAAAAGFTQWCSVMGVGMRVMVLGGDGFCGWPTSLYLSDRGHEVTIVDNLSRRKIDVELEVESLTPIRPIGERISVWRDTSGRDIGYVNLDLATEYDRLGAGLKDLRPG